MSRIEMDEDNYNEDDVGWRIWVGRGPQAHPPFLAQTRGDSRAWPSNQAGILPVF